MYNEKKKKNKNSIVIFISIFLIVIAGLFYSLKLNRKMTTIEAYLKDISVLIQKVVLYPFTALNKEKDIDLSDSYLIQKNINSSLEKEIEELKETLKLNSTFTEYKPVNATVLSRNKSYWFK